MNISKDKVVKIHYTLKDVDGGVDYEGYKEH